MREQFEKLPKIESVLKSHTHTFTDGHYSFKGNTNNPKLVYAMGFTNGALYAYQEQQRKIDAIIKAVDWHIEDCGLVEDTEYNKAWLEAMIFVKRELLK